MKRGGISETFQAKGTQLSLIRAGGAVGSVQSPEVSAGFGIKTAVTPA